MADVGLSIQRAKDKTEQMQARASAIDELTAAGTLEDYTAAGDDLDRQLSQISQGSQVDSELAKMKAELGEGDERRHRGAAVRGRRDGAEAVIVRLMGDAQYRVDDALKGRLNELDDEVAGRSRRTTRPPLAGLAALAEAVREHGERLADDSLEPSDAIVPPEDLSLEEARELLAGEGLIPDLPVA